MDSQFDLQIRQFDHLMVVGTLPLYSVFYSDSDDGDGSSTTNKIKEQLICTQKSKYDQHSSCLRTSAILQLHASTYM